MNPDVILIFLSSLWLIYSLIRGIKEGYLRFKTNSKLSNGPDIKRISYVQDLAALTPMCMVVLISNDLIHSLIFLVVAILSFIGIQNWAYYRISNKLDPIKFDSKNEEDIKENRPYIYLSSEIRKGTDIVSAVLYILLFLRP